MSSIYPPHVLVLPLYVQHRIPSSLHNVDIELVLVVHTLLSLFASLFTVHIAYALPLSLFGLVAVSASLVPTLLPHFLFFWIISIPFDIVWLLYRVNQARLLIISIMGANMCFKLLSAMQAARILQSQGALPEVGGGGYSGIGANTGWLGANGSGDSGPFGLPGSWSGQQQHESQAPYADARQSGPPHASSGGYHSVYDEEDAVGEGDALPVRISDVGK